MISPFGEMEGMMKTLCKLKKNELADEFKKILKIVKKPKFICEKCARVAHEKKYLCNAIAMKPKSD